MLEISFYPSWLKTPTRVSQNKLRDQNRRQKRLISTSRQILTADWPIKAVVSAGIWTDWRQRTEWINLIGWQNLRKMELNNARSICVHESCTCKQTLPVHKSVHVIRINIINPAYAKNDIPISQTSRTAVAVKIHPDYDSETRGKCRENYYSPASKKCEKSSTQPNDLQSCVKNTTN